MPAQVFECCKKDMATVIIKSSADCVMPELPESGHTVGPGRVAADKE